MSENTLSLIDQLYNTRCDGLWEHDYGLDITSCDNPGWWLKWKDKQAPFFFQEERHKHKLKAIQQRHKIQITLPPAKSETSDASSFEIHIFGSSLQAVLNAFSEIMEAEFES